MLLFFFFIVFAYCVVDRDFICSHVSKENKIKTNYGLFKNDNCTRFFLFLYVIFPPPVLSHNIPTLSNDIKTIHVPVPLHL